MSEKNYSMIKDIQKHKTAIFIAVLYVIIFKIILRSICPLVFFTGFPCPACGLTRAGKALLSGAFVEAWHTHPFIYVIIGFVVFFLVFHYVFQKNIRYFQKYLIALILLMIVYYIYRMIRYFPSDPPISYYYNSVLGRILKYI